MKSSKLRVSSGAGTGFGSSPSSGRSSFSRANFATPSRGNLSYLAEQPDLTAISDANIVVAFKNLLKRDGNTKAKALEELVTFARATPFEADGGVEDPVLETWVQLYPRTSIDDTRRVRELSHTLQLELMKSARKRMEKHVPRIVGTWLSGSFDKDRVVARAAEEGLSSFLQTDTKVTQFWARCHSQILEYATDAIRESADTLSDERSTIKEDAENKYNRVLGGALSLVYGLLQKLPQAEVEKHRSSYDGFFAAATFWNCATSGDSFVRRATYRLLRIWVDRREHEEWVVANLPRLGRTLLQDGLQCSQTGSALDYLQLITKLTIIHPEIWTGKSQPLVRLRPFAEKGSQGSATNVTMGFWECLEVLIRAVPQNTISSSVAVEVARSLRTGVSHREEPRSNALRAWSAYLSAVQHLATLISQKEDKISFLGGSIYPLFRQYLHPTPETSTWDSGARLPVLSAAFSTFLDPSLLDATDSTTAEWTSLAKQIGSRMENSLPETSKDYETSQEAVAGEAGRWFSLVEAIEKKLDPGSPASTTSVFVSHVVRRPSMELLGAAVDVLARRKYKPFGAASLIAEAFQHCLHLISTAGKPFVQLLFPLDSQSDLALFLESRSANYLLPCLTALARLPDFSDYYESAYQAIAEALAVQDNQKTPVLVAELIKGVENAAAPPSVPLQEYLRRTCLGYAEGSNESWELFRVVTSSPAIVEETSAYVAQGITKLVSRDSRIDQSRLLRALELLTSNRPQIFAKSEVLQLELMTRLLSVMEVSTAAISAMARTICDSLEKHATGQLLLKIIQENLDQAGTDSLEVSTLVEQARILTERGTAKMEDVLPSTINWRSALQCFVDTPDPSLSLTSALGGAYFLLPGGPRLNNTSPKRDRIGYSSPARMAVFTAQLLSSSSEFLSLPQAFQVELLFMLYLMTEVSSDQLAVGSLHNPWAETALGHRQDVEDFVSSTRKTLQEVVTGGNLPGGVIDDLITTMLQQSHLNLGPWALYSARALCELLQVVVDARGFNKDDEARLERLDTRVGPSTVLGLTAILMAYGDALSSSPTVSTLCNRLISDIAGAKLETRQTMMTLVVLNACMSIYSTKLPVAANRLVFAVKHITSWFETPELVDAKLAAENCRVLQRLLPCIKDVYGSHWELTVKFCFHLWDRAADAPASERLPYTYASLKLISTLQSMSDSNDDLEDALRIESDARTMSVVLVNLLSLPHAGGSQPEEIVESLISRMATRTSSGHVDPMELYGLMASDSRAIQSAAFVLLERALPSVMHDLSEEVLLQPENQQTPARLPEEILSLLLDAPTLEAYPEEVLSKFPTPVRSYLLSWRLLFTAFNSASIRVRQDFVEHLKEASLVEPLLNFMFDWLGHSASHALDLDKEGLPDSSIREYDIDGADAELEEKNMNWVLVNVFFLVLKFVPGLFKAWYLDCKSKQTKVAVLNWTEKFFSGILISETFDEVQKWADEQEADEEQLLTVKVNKVAREVVAGYEIDELVASIVIKLPTTYPIEPVIVSGIHRVGASEKKWNSWIMATQGVITYSNGSIVDGLIAFRRNVFGALKGQTECAICYSIVSEDKKMPDKRCGTCKNSFHRYCLYKWFQTSGHNLCPLCRNAIDYLGADTNRRTGRGENF